MGEISGMSFARENFIAGLSRGKLLAPMCFQGTCNTGLFNTWLEKMVGLNCNPVKHLFLTMQVFIGQKKVKNL